MQYIASLDGTTLAVADGTLPSPRAHVVIVHGYAEHSGRYDELVRTLEENDFAAHRFDLRGHGHSGGVRAHIGRFDEYIDDMRAVLGHVNEHRPDTSPLFVLGHSLGGLISLEYCRRSPEAMHGVVVSSPFLHPAFEVPAAKRFLAKGASLLADRAEKVSSVALAVGDGSEAAFSRAFKKATGISPASWRERLWPAK